MRAQLYANNNKKKKQQENSLLFIIILFFLCYFFFFLFFLCKKRAHNLKRDCYKEFHFFYHTKFLPCCRRVADVDKNYCYKCDLITLVTFVCCTTVFYLISFHLFHFLFRIFGTLFGFCISLLGKQCSVCAACFENTTLSTQITLFFYYFSFLLF